MPYIFHANEKKNVEIEPFAKYNKASVTGAELFPIKNIGAEGHSCADILVLLLLNGPGSAQKTNNPNMKCDQNKKEPSN
jgi:hypothetical protein